ncbi:hypothetical protein RvY_16102 [Ramazzottius varieornatus]|uniref:Uncharacterized protein n=1 Tax=Ramazzottius varieornatus TaxID=947166 RepID=A0A1D1VYM6_RAMVA|nr:hypothetical protein RvY_16102 [Ramazzottius varieornatus]
MVGQKCCKLETALFNTGHHADVAQTVIDDIHKRRCNIHKGLHAGETGGIAGERCNAAPP